MAPKKAASKSAKQSAKPSAEQLRIPVASPEPTAGGAAGATATAATAGGGGGGERRGSERRGSERAGGGGRVFGYAELLEQSNSLYNPGSGMGVDYVPEASDEPYVVTTPRAKVRAMPPRQVSQRIVV
eukprot:Selendium_serpulae@DN8987_c0_g1_i1.p2